MAVTQDTQTGGGRAGLSFFEELYHTYRTPMYRIALSILHDEGLAEDAVQQTFIKIFQGLEKIDPTDRNKTKSFIVILVKNTSIDLYRKRRRDNLIYWDDLERPEEGQQPSPEDQVLAGIGYAQLRQGLHDMEDKYKDILILRYYQGYQNKEIAQMLGLTEPQVAMRIFKGKKKLAAQLKGGCFHEEE